MTRYSQNDEQDIILAHFGDKADGHLLDIGAFDGTSFSNSRALIDRGWHGCMIEPSPWPFATMTKLYWSNPRVCLINACVVPERQEPQLLRFLATEDAISCQEEKTAALWGREKFRHIFVSPMTVSAIPPAPDGAKYDFVTIDIEDGTMPLVKELINRTRFLHDASLIVLEHTAGGITCRDEMKAVMAILGKTIIHTTPENYIFAVRN